MSKSRNRSSCARIPGVLFDTLRASADCRSVLPLGSPMRPVPPPTRRSASGRARCKCAARSSRAASHVKARCARIEADIAGDLLSCKGVAHALQWRRNQPRHSNSPTGPSAATINRRCCSVVARRSRAGCHRARRSRRAAVYGTAYERHQIGATESCCRCSAYRLRSTVFALDF